MKRPFRAGRTRSGAPRDSDRVNRNPAARPGASRSACLQTTQGCPFPSWTSPSTGAALSSANPPTPTVRTGLAVRLLGPGLLFSLRTHLALLCMQEALAPWGPHSITGSGPRVLPSSPHTPSQKTPDAGLKGSLFGASPTARQLHTRSTHTRSSHSQVLSTESQKGPSPATNQDHRAQLQKTAPPFRNTTRPSPPLRSDANKCTQSLEFQNTEGSKSLSS